MIVDDFAYLRKAVKNDPKAIAILAGLSDELNETRNENSKLNDLSRAMMDIFKVMKALEEYSDHTKQ